MRLSFTKRQYTSILVLLTYGPVCLYSLVLITSGRKELCVCLLRSCLFNWLTGLSLVMCLITWTQGLVYDSDCGIYCNSVARKLKSSRTSKGDY